MVLAASLDAVVDWRIRPLGHRLGPEDTGAGCSAAPGRGGRTSKMLARPRTPPSTECEMVLAASLDAVVDWRIRPLGHRLGPEDTGAGCSAAPARGGGASGQDWREKLESASPRLLLRPPPANRLPTVAARPSRLPRRRLSQDADASAPSRSSSEDSSPSSAILLLSRSGDNAGVDCARLERAGTVSRPTPPPLRAIPPPLPPGSTAGGAIGSPSLDRRSLDLWLLRRCTHAPVHGANACTMACRVAEPRRPASRLPLASVAARWRVLASWVSEAAFLGGGGGGNAPFFAPQLRGGAMPSSVD